MLSVDRVEWLHYFLFLAEIILQVSADQPRAAVVVSQQSLASLGEQEEDYEAGSE